MALDSLGGCLEPTELTLAVSQRDFNPNYQDMAVLGASRAYKDWQVANGLAEEAEDAEKAPTEPAVPVSSDIKDYSDSELKVMEEEDPLSLIDSLNSRVGTPVLSTVTSSAFARLWLRRRQLADYRSYAQSSASRITCPTSGGPSTTTTRSRSLSCSSAPASSTSRPPRVNLTDLVRVPSLYFRHGVSG